MFSKLQKHALEFGFVHQTIEREGSGDETYQRIVPGKRPCALAALQLKHQKVRESSCTEKVPEWFNYPRTSAHPRSKVSFQGY